MDQITQLLDSTGFHLDSFFKTTLILLVGAFLLSLVGRLIFGKRSVLNNAASSAIGILFIYIVTVILQSAGAEFSQFVAPMPFVNITQNQLFLFSFRSAHYTVLCTEILSMIILSFLVNLADGWLPHGRSIFSWVFFRGLTVVIGYLMHLVVAWLFSSILPAEIVTYAPVILLALLLLLLLLGAIKAIFGKILTSVNPLIGGLYKFFFANAIGKQITRSILTTAILAAMITALHYLGINVISITSSAMAAYFPFLIILIAIWYVIFKFF